MRLRTRAHAVRTPRGAALGPIVQDLRAHHTRAVVHGVGRYRWPRGPGAPRRAAMSRAASSTPPPVPAVPARYGSPPRPHPSPAPPATWPEPTPRPTPTPQPMRKPGPTSTTSRRQAPSPSITQQHPPPPPAPQEQHEDSAPRTSQLLTQESGRWQSTRTRWGAAARAIRQSTGNHHSDAPAAPTLCDGDHRTHGGYCPRAGSGHRLPREAWRHRRCARCSDRLWSGAAAGSPAEPTARGLSPRRRQ